MWTGCSPLASPTTVHTDGPSSSAFPYKSSTGGSREVERAAGTALKPILLLGPTAVGKSAVAVEVALALGGEVVPLDSRQVYRGMEIGTAQPSESERLGVPHHLYGNRDPREPISAGEFARLADAKLKEVQIHGKVAIACGGSGLYYRALTRGIFSGSRTDQAVRSRLGKRLKKEGAEALLEELRVVDPAYAKIVHPNNHKRLLRALEILESTGLTPTEHFLRQKASRRGEFFSVYLRPSRDLLDRRISERTAQLLAKGWVEEVRRLVEDGVPVTAHPLDSLGYREILAHLRGEVSVRDLPAVIDLRTRQYARRQMRWFDKEAVDLCVKIERAISAEAICGEIVSFLKGQNKGVCGDQGRA